MIYNSYLFISSNDNKIIGSSNIFDERFKYRKNIKINDKQVIIYNNYQGDNSKIFESKINDFKNYEEHSLISRAEFDVMNNLFSCFTDKFGVQNHYYYYNSETFLCSNNIFYIYYIVKPEISIYSIYDAILFRKPYGKNTWFNDISCLKYGEMLDYKVSNHEINSKIYFDTFNYLMTSNDNNYIDTFIDFFEKYKGIYPDENNILALSAGSDSRLILAALINKKINFETFSFGGTDYLETYKIKKFCKKFGIKNTLIDFNELFENYDNYLGKAVFYTNGLAPSVNYYYFYSKLPDNKNLFQGYWGSEFVKGELSDGMFTNFYYDIIKNGVNLDNAVEKYLPNVDDNIKKDMKSYFLNTYNYLLNHTVDTENGKIAFQRYLLEFLPSKIFSGVVVGGLAFNRNLYLPYFSPIFLRNLFGAGLGIKNHLSIRNDYPGGSKIIQTQAKIVKLLDKRIYNSLLDRNITYAESFLPLWTIKLLKIYRNFIDKNLIKRYPITKQFDDSEGRKISKYFSKPLHEKLSFIASDKSETSNEYLNYVSVYLNIFDDIINKI